MKSKPREAVTRYPVAPSNYHRLLPDYVLVVRPGLPQVHLVRPIDSRVYAPRRPGYLSVSRVVETPDSVALHSVALHRRPLLVATFPHLLLHYGPLFALTTAGTYPSKGQARSVFTPRNSTLSFHPSLRSVPLALLRRLVPLLVPNVYLPCRFFSLYPRL